MKTCNQAPFSTSKKLFILKLLGFLPEIVSKVPSNLTGLKADSSKLLVFVNFSQYQHMVLT